jgi:hypothetical protein
MRGKPVYKILNCYSYVNQIYDGQELRMPRILGTQRGLRTPGTLRTQGTLKRQGTPTTLRTLGTLRTSIIHIPGGAEISTTVKYI